MSDYQGNIVIKNPATPAGPAQNGAAPGMWKLSEAMAFKRQGIWPTQGVVPSDPLFPYVSMLLSTTSLGNANNNLFVDSSGMFSPINRVGNTTQGSFTPYSASWSNYFDGTGDYLSNSGSGVLTGDFTIEMWGYFQGFVSGLYTIGTETTQRVGFYITSGGLLAWDLFAAGTTTFSGATVPLRTWVHIAFVKSGTSITAYLNGVSAGTRSMNYTVGNANGFYVGGNGGGMNGYLSNFRVVNGTAVYTSDFTPPTAPLTAITNTFLLTCQSNRFRDASTNNFTLTRNGDVTVTDFSPFTPAYPGISYDQSDITNWSGYFDGSGDYLTLPSGAAFQFGTGDFTVECWVYSSNAASTSYVIVDARNSGQTGTWVLFRNINNQIEWYNGSSSYVTSTNIPANQWNHVAYSRSGTTGRVLLNGAVIGTFTDATNYSVSPTTSYIGCRYSVNEFFNGSISNFRTVKGTALYTGSYTVPTAPLTAISGTSLLTLQNAAFTDNSTNNFVITPFGNTTVTGNSPFNTVGYWSNYFDGAGDYLTVPSNAALTFGTGDFTVEFWINVPSFANFRQHVSTRPSDNASYWSIDSKADGTFYFYTSTFVITTAAQPTNAWLHIAAVRASGTLTLYVNGVSQGSASLTNDFLANTLGIGAGPSGAQPTVGNISNLRIVKGTAVYTTAFTPPTAPLTAISGTSLLTCQNGRFIDNSTNAFAITVNGNTTVQSFNPFYAPTMASNGGSMYNDGTGDYLSLGSSAAFTPELASFTWECWFYPTAPAADTVFWLTDVYLGFQIGYNGTSSWGIARTGFQWFLTSTTLPTPGQWNHIAVSRDRALTTMALFLNGVRLATKGDFGTNYLAAPTYVQGIPSGYSSAGYMTDVRFTKGTAVYSTASATYTVPTAPLTPTPNTTFLLNGMNAGIYDAAAISSFETLGDTKVTTAVSKFGGSSVYFDGTTDYMVVSGNKIDWTWLHNGQQNWTIEFWSYNVNTNSMGVLCTNTNSTNNAYGTVMGLNLMNGAGSIGGHFTRGVDGARMDWYTAGGILAANQWNFVVLQFNTTTKNMEVYLNGVSQAVTNQNVVGNTPTGGDGSAFAYSNNPPTFSPNIGRVVGPVTIGSYFNGYIDEMRITRGVRRYTSNFTPPTQAFPPY